MAEEALELTARLDESVLTAWAALTVARAAVAAGDSRRAVEVLDAPERLDPVPGVWRLIGYEALVMAYLDLGRAGRRRADRGAGAGARRGARAADGDRVGAADRGGGRARRRRSPRAPRGTPPAAIAAAEAAGAEVEVALTRMLAARALAATGDTDAAAAQLEQAGATFTACGAPLQRNAAEQQLRQLGRSIHRRSRPGAADGTGVASLTGRELEVARLVVDRRTNQEIADELFLSLKTVETHMRNMFRKLDVSSRVDLARAIEAAGV